MSKLLCNVLKIPGGHLPPPSWLVARLVVTLSQACTSKEQNILRVPTKSLRYRRSDYIAKFYCIFAALRSSTYEYMTAYIFKTLSFPPLATRCPSVLQSTA